MHDESEVAEQNEQPSPRPIAQPPSVDFGTVRRGESPRQQVLIDNAGGQETGVQVRYLELNSWFRIVGVEPLDDDHILPIVVEVQADTRHLRLNQTYESAIVAVMDGVQVPIQLRIRVARFHFSVSRRLAIAVATALAVLTIGSAALFLTTGPASVRTTGETTGTSVSPRDASVAEEGRAPSDPATVAAPQPQSQRFVYTTRLDDMLTLALVDAAGKERELLAANGTSPAWSPDGTRVAYIAAGESGPRLHVLNMGSSKPQPATQTDAASHSVTWSPDGSRIAFVEDGGEGGRVQTLEVAGTRLVAATEDVVGMLDGDVWSGDGRWLAYAAELNGRPVVHVLDVDSNESAPITSFGSWEPAWSPNGERLAVASEKGIYAVNRDGRDVLRLTPFVAWSPAWSEDGTSLAFLTDWSNPDGVADIWTLTGDMLEPQRLTDSESDVLRFSWLSDGARLAYVVEKPGELPTTYELWITMPDTAPQFVTDLATPYFAWIP